MPWRIEKRDEKFCVVKDDESGETVACHDSEDEAKSQMAALYANEGRAGDARAFVALGAEPIGEDGRQWVEVIPTAEKARNGPWYFTITEDDLEVYAESIRSSGGKIAIDRDHDTDEGRSSRAAGWFTGEAEVRKADDGPRLWAEVEWSKSGREDVEGKEYRFISPVFDFAEKDTKTGLMTKATAILRATLTNRPFFTQLAPVTAADLHADDPAVVTLAKNLDKTPEEILVLAAEESGATVWDARFGLEGLRERLNASLNPPAGDGLGFDWRYWIMDVALAAQSGRALVRENQGQATWVVPFDIAGDGSVSPSARGEWIEARQEWVAAASAALEANAAVMEKPPRPFEELEADIELRRSLPALSARRSLRVRAGVSLDEFAATCGITSEELRGWESGETTPEGVPLRRYAEALDRLKAPV